MLLVFIEFCEPCWHRMILHAINFLDLLNRVVNLVIREAWAD